MNINSSLNFKGKYYLTSDTHSKSVSLVNLLSKISDNAKTEDKPTFLLDNGDTFIKNNPYTTDIFSTFINSNKNIKTVFNLGNSEYFNLIHAPKEYSASVKKLTKKGANFICTPIEYICENNKKINKKDIKDIKPYAIVKDKINGVDENILIVGTLDIRNDILLPEKQAEILAKTIKKAREEYKPYKTILLSHNFIDNTKIIIDELKKLGIDDIEFVLGGHSHTLEDENYLNKTRIVHPGAMSKAAFAMELNKDGFQINPIKFDMNNPFDCSKLINTNNKDIITNVVKKPQITDKYKNIFKNSDIFQPVCIAKKTINNRELTNISYPVSYPSDLGTLYANELKEKTNSDFAITISQDIRGELPYKGETIYKYNIDEMLGPNDPIWIMNLNKKEIFDIFNISLKEQHKSISNSDFLEYSNNIMIHRYPNIEDERILSYDTNGKLNEQRIKEIYLKDENGIWKTLDENKIYKVATTKILANGERPSLAYFKTINDKYEYPGRLYPRDILIDGIKNVQEKGLNRSIMCDV